jgi:hypothetical protein
MRHARLWNLALVVSLFSVGVVSTEAEPLLCARLKSRSLGRSTRLITKAAKDGKCSKRFSVLIDSADVESSIGESGDSGMQGAAGTDGLKGGKGDDVFANRYSYALIGSTDPLSGNSSGAFYLGHGLNKPLSIFQGIDAGNRLVNDCRLRNLEVKLASPLPDGIQYTFDVLVDGVGSLLTCSIDSGQTACSSGAVGVLVDSSRRIALRSTPNVPNRNSIPVTFSVVCDEPEPI